MKRIHVACTDCPWTGTYTSEAKATYAHRRHSCDRWNAKAEAAARGAARRAAVDRTPKPCLHKQASHVHGTHACYVLDACRCTPCAKAEGDYERARVKAHAYGRWNGYVPAGRARAHVLHLMQQGMGLKRIVAVSGVSQGLLWKLVYGKRKADGTRTPSKRVRPVTEARILAVKPDLAPGAVVDATGTRRRLQALATLGWSIETIAQRTGRERQSLDAIIKAERASTTRRTADAVRAVYDDLWNVPRTPEKRSDGPAISRIRNAAQRAGWAPPMAYDDIDIDDPCEEIDDMAKKNAGYTRWTPFEERFWGRVDTSSGDCWEWTGKKTEKGYGSRIGYMRDYFYPHQLSYILYVGAIPEGLVIDHLCRNRACVNPDHLEAVTAEENTRRGVEARWSEPCPNGHPAEQHRRALPSGKNICTECRRISDKERDDRNRDNRRASARQRYANQKPSRTAAVIEDTEHLLRSGIPAHDIATRLGYKHPDGLERVLFRAGRHDLATRIHNNGRREPAA